MVTGLGIITSIGKNLEENLQALREGRPGIGDIVYPAAGEGMGIPERQGPLLDGAGVEIELAERLVIIVEEQAQPVEEERREKDGYRQDDSDQGNDLFFQRFPRRIRQFLSKPKRAGG